jgi:excisionase family DNA binding protein
MCPLDTPTPPNNRAERRGRNLVTIALAADHLGVVPKTVRNYVSRGLLTAYRIPGTRGVRLDLDEVDAAMRLIPTTVARPATTQFGPKARIVTLPRRVEAEPEV